LINNHRRKQMKPKKAVLPKKEFTNGSWFYSSEDWCQYVRVEFVAKKPVTEAGDNIPVTELVRALLMARGFDPIHVVNLGTALSMPHRRYSDVGDYHWHVPPTDRRLPS
jgi:hypothetical protein